MKIEHSEVWRVLHEECGANAKMDDGFPHHWPECREYRFMGALGFGGKVWSYDDRWYVNCYPENMTPERGAMIENANQRLSELRAALSTPRRDVD